MFMPAVRAIRVCWRSTLRAGGTGRAFLPIKDSERLLLVARILRQSPSKFFDWEFPDAIAVKYVEPKFGFIHASQISIPFAP